MNVDSKFNKRSTKKVACNYTAVASKFYAGSGEAINLKFYGTTELGDLSIDMNVLEAHRLIGQLNEALSAHAKVALKNSDGTKS